jgi:hypothetical protein
MTETSGAPVPKISRVKMGTTAAPDLGPMEEWYSQWLGYSVVERGSISETLAASWGATGVAGNPYILMRPESGADVYIRAVQSEAVPGYQPLTTFGWNAWEIVIEDVYKLNERLVNSPFKIIGPPASIGMDYPTIHAMQVIGPAQEVLYLTCDTGPKEESLLPDPGSFVGRNFIFVMAGPGTAGIHDFYTARFDIEPQEERDAQVGIIAKANGLPEDHPMKMAFVALAEEANFLEIDGYPEPATPRPQVAGQLPPGNAIGSFSVKSLDDLDVEFITEPVRDASLAYGGCRSATFIGPVGEITELVEEPR